MTDSASDLLAEIDATLKLGRERHLDFRERAFNLLTRLRPLVEREAGDIRCRELVQEIADSPIGCSSRSSDYLDWVGDVQYKARKALEPKP